ncbi:AMP-binding protein [Natronoflexus pectinivorans]|uniref:Long-chain acyl-CoA synthetase n=1 Tax=Natronoflexus pectinivorans TaxID=682526 RepID=A0A4R2GP36_9BACT|nr:AMP-binding protein [Natronoflexus pectinivorans]TCO10817.1 long-chain acyl-CoA synthetase [Natronoflexus pectinivorans]
MEANGYLSMVEKAIVENADSIAFSDFKGEDHTFRQVGKAIFKLHVVFKELGVKKGDKIALIGRNMSNWGICYLATVTYGAVTVPILPDFHSNDIHHIINHSESVLLLSSDLMFDKIDEGQIPDVKGIISVNSYEPLVDRKGKLKKALTKADEITGNGKFDVTRLMFPKMGTEEVMVLSYTSGTSGFSKGVLLPHRSIWSNVKYASDTFDLVAGNRIVSFLPMAHAYGCLFEFLWPFITGCHITFLTRTPSPQIITEAFREVKPHLILSVPLILEKIFKRRIMPKLEKPGLKALLKVPVINKLIYNKVRSTLFEVFGGEFKEMVVGGAALNRDVELFLKKINFPITVGYGMTECGPLISYAPWDKTETFSAGSIVDRMQVRIDSEDPYNVVGEIQVKGDNTLLGYFKNDKATREIFTDDGWIHTGDLGVIDENDFIFIRGRSKNMILGASGQNIYPEEIEAVIGSKELVQECLVRESDGKIEALIYPDYEVCDLSNCSSEEIETVMQKLRSEVNSELPPYMAVSKMIIFPEEFEKTPKKSIKRYKYVK